MRKFITDAKVEINECKSIDIRSLKKQGFLYGRMAGTLSWENRWGKKNTIGIDISPTMDYMHLNYDYFYRYGEVEHCSYNIQLVSTPCFYGGIRFWFLCPLIKEGIPCNKRVVVLYCKERYFGCRDCLQLAYPTQFLRKNEFEYYIRAQGKGRKLLQDIHTYFYNDKMTRKYKSLLKIQKYLLENKDKVTIISPRMQNRLDNLYKKYEKPRFVKTK